MSICRLCPNDCRVDRSKAVGLCRTGEEMTVCRIAPHFYEEPCISGKNGSGTVFFSGCGLDCLFCQNHEISKREAGKRFTPSELADELKRLVDSGVHNINFVTPTHFSEKIIETLELYRPPVPIVYNTSGFEKVEVIKKLNDYVDVYLTDFKYADNEIAFKYSQRRGYFDSCFSATSEMVRAKKLVYDADGMLQRGVIVRHLYLPGEWENTRRVIDIFAENWKDEAIFSLMSQFFPTYKSPIKRTLKPIENKLAIKRIIDRGIENCYVQETSSADCSFVPSWDLL